MTPEIREKLKKILHDYPGSFYADQKERDEALDAIAKVVVESLPPKKDEGKHKDHDCFDEYCATCKECMSEEEWYAYWSSYWNNALDQIREAWE